ncbi:MAG: hypothetical protein H6760_04510 [Candidatus Nomurabacteria bacterium]|nr:MAG: hypothetical protein H6760_04510 [Candidatus Nomurabacteria bacterium]
MHVDFGHLPRPNEAPLTSTCTHPELRRKAHDFRVQLGRLDLAVRREGGLHRVNGSDPAGVRVHKGTQPRLVVRVESDGETAEQAFYVGPKRGQSTKDLLGVLEVAFPEARFLEDEPVAPPRQEE